jgi:uncharacterized protein (DUF2235 family)
MESPKKRLVLCFDGTWNTVAVPMQVSNVVRIANAVAGHSADGTPQIVYYNSGVGSGGPIDRFLGGAFGLGLRSNVQRGLAFLGLNYERGDEIYLFGFSRGAYTARALAGIVGLVGIPLDFSKLADHWVNYCRLADLRHQRKHLAKHGGPPAEVAAVDAELRKIEADLGAIPRIMGVPIECVGVWDTVGSYGIPKGFGPMGLARQFTSWTRGFRDTHLGPRVKLGLHAIAVDERRRPFEPTFWTMRPPEDEHDINQPYQQKVEQVWFSGVHVNVGGGCPYPSLFARMRDWLGRADAGARPSSGLSDLALVWMITRVADETGLEFTVDPVAGREDFFTQAVWPCSAATLFRSDKGLVYRIFGGRVRTILSGLHAAIPAPGMLDRIKKRCGLHVPEPQERINELVHWSVDERRGWASTLVDGLADQPYRPSNVHRHVRFTVKTDRESKLIARLQAAHANRPPEHCPMARARQPCRCVPVPAAAAPPDTLVH